ncbi:hypothetical protein FRB99_000859 [Tulasnella sp. 403]|nr:hypothetical protein FRB99_000859 [Tulasnella sp. 403]
MSGSLLGPAPNIYDDLCYIRLRHEPVGIAFIVESNVTKTKHWRMILVPAKVTDTFALFGGDSAYIDRPGMGNGQSEDTAGFIPPTTIAISQALDILLRDAAHSNGLPFPRDLDTPYDAIIAHVKLLECSAHALHEEVISRRVALYRKRNVHAPLLQLPPEIFGRILYLAVEDDHYPTWRRRLLCLVGRAWNHAIRSTPDLWTFVESRDSSKQVDDALRLSGQLPLRIKWNKRCTQNLDKFISQSRRWGELEIVDYRPPDEQTASLLAATTSNLTSLSIFSIGSRSDGYVALMGGGANLRYLNLRGLCMNWGSARLSGLITLYLSAISNPPSVSRLLEILVASPHINTLELCNWECREDQARIPPILPSLTFPHLVHLRLSKIPVNYTLAIMKHIQAPQCSDFSLNHLTSPECGLFQWTDSGFASLVRQLLAPNGEASQLKVTLYDSSLSLASGFRWMGKAFYLTMEHFDLPYCLRVIANFITQLKLGIQISIDIVCWTQPYHPFLLGVLDLLSPTIIALSIGGEPKRLLEYLLQPHQEPDGVHRWPCSNLRVLELRSTGRRNPPVDHTMVVAFLKGRWGTANSRPETQDYSRPQKLECLSFRNHHFRPGGSQRIYEAEQGLFNFVNHSNGPGVACTFGFRSLGGQ